MCHQKPERSFHINGRQFPLCARCTGILAGYFLGILLLFVLGFGKHLWLSLLIIPMTVDGIMQQALKIESNNFRRFITGIMGGIAIIYMLVSIHIFTVWLAKIFLDKIGAFPPRKRI